MFDPKITEGRWEVNKYGIESLVPSEERFSDNEGNDCFYVRRKGNSSSTRIVRGL